MSPMRLSLNESHNVRNSYARRRTDAERPAHRPRALSIRHAGRGKFPYRIKGPALRAGPARLPGLRSVPARALRRARDARCAPPGGLDTDGRRPYGPQARRIAPPCRAGLTRALVTERPTPPRTRVRRHKFAIAPHVHGHMSILGAARRARTPTSRQGRANQSPQLPHEPNFVGVHAGTQGSPCSKFGNGVARDLRSRVNGAPVACIVRDHRTSHHTPTPRQRIGPATPGAETDRQRIDGHQGLR